MAELKFSPLTENVYIVSISEPKKDVTQEFLHFVIARWNGYEQTIKSADGKEYVVSVTEKEQI